MAGLNKSRQLRHLARSNNDSGEKAFPRLGQKVRSTKQPVKDKQRTIPNAKKMHDVYIKIHNVTETMHIDQTSRFPATSTRGNQYIMVLVEVDGNHRRRTHEE
jgi:hypothetical protein